MASRQIAGLEVLISANATRLQEALGQGVGALNRFQKQAQNVQRILGALGVGVGLYQLGSVIRDAVNVFKEFEFKMSEVKAITNATDVEFKQLSEDALRLGRSTVFTAREVAGLQVAYGRLGFSTQEIINATEATLNLAAATNSELADAADVAGSTVRGFQLDASETVRVTDVMTSSFNKSALAIDYFRESMKFVAPVANAANATVEETTALLGVLANAGIRGSIAGTSLRRIFSDLTKDGRPLRDRLQELATKGLTLADAYDEIGRVSQTSLLVLTRNIDAYDRLTLALENSAGEAERVAAIRLDNLQGDVIRLTSAWEGFLLSIQKSEFYRQFITNLTLSFNQLSGSINQSSTLISALGTQFARIDDKRLSNLFGLNAQNNIDNFLEKLRELVIETGKPVQIELIERAISRFQLGTEVADKFRSAVIEINKELTGFTGTSFDVFINLNNELDKARKRFEDLPLDTSADQIKRVADEVFALETRINNLTTAKLSDFFEKAAFNAQELANRLRGIKEEDLIVFGDEPGSRTNLIINQAKKGVIELTASYTELVATKNFLTAETEKLGSKEEAEILRKAELIRFLEVEIQRRKDLLKIKKEEARPGVETIPIDFGNLEGALSGIAAGGKSALDKIDFKSTLQAGELAIFDGIDFENALDVFAQFNKDLIEQVDTFKETSENLSRITNVFAGVFVNIGQAIGDSIAGVGNFGDALLKIIADFGSQFGALLIATGFAKESFDKFSGPAMIAAGVALVIASQAVRASISKRPSLSGSSAGSSGGSSSFAFAQDSAPIRLVSDVQIRGQDLYVILSNYEKNNRNTRNG